MRFGNPAHFWFLLLLPLLGLFFLWALVRKRQALEVFAGTALRAKLTQNVSRRRQYGKYMFLLAGVLFLVLALTAPQFGAKPTMAQRRGVDVMVLLDVSRSMLAQDLKPSRLERAKYQIGHLLDRLHGDRVGLVVFAGQAFVQCPLTLDYGAIQMFLDIVDTTTIPVQGTAIGEALELAVRSFTEEDQHKVVILFTDGEDHLGDPLQVAEKLAEEGARIFAVGLGTADGELIPGLEEGAGLSYHKDRQGQYVKTRLDEATLRQIALATDGDYFRSSLQGGELDAIGEHIAQMDQKDFGVARFTRYKERFQIPLFLALVCFTIEALMADRRRHQEEWRGRFA